MFKKKGLELPKFKENWSINIRSPRGSVVSSATHKESEKNLEVFINSSPSSATAEPKKRSLVL